MHVPLRRGFLTSYFVYKHLLAYVTCDSASRAISCSGLCIYIAGGKSQLLLSPIQIYSCMPRYGTCSVSSPVDFASAGSSALSV